MDLHQASQPDGIAIVGMSGRFPGAQNCEQLWANLVDGRECLTRFTDDDLRKAGIDPSRIASDRPRTRGVVANADQFDASLFGLSPREAEMMDPQQRVLLEVAWESLENAGYDHARPPGQVGVFVGSGINTYYRTILSHQGEILDSYGALPTVLLNEKDFLATRIAYCLNLKGPAVNIQTACSTSLVAICNACQSLLSYECDMALAGAAHLAFPQCYSTIHDDGGMISADGHCRPFDHAASGTVFSDGVGIICLRRLDDALADGDNIIAVIRGYGVNNDGSDKAGYTAPSVNGQAQSIKMAHAFADIDPKTISYVEAHGTGTRLGDPIEVLGLTEAFGHDGDQKQYCGIGSVKSNLGHLDVAAGVAGVIKTAMAIRHRKLPPTIHYDSPNAEIDFAETPFYVVDRLVDWKVDSGPLRAGVSSFGMGGTNAHLVLEEPPRQPSVSANHRSAAGVSAASDHECHLLTLSAQSPEALSEASHRLADHLAGDHPESLADVAFTLQTGRHEFAYRRSVVCRNAAQASELLRSERHLRANTSSAKQSRPALVFMFPGQGSQRVNMGRQLYQSEPVYRELVDQCVELLKPALGLDLREMLFPNESGEPEAAQRLTQTQFTQPALFVTEYALAQLWQSWGVKPDAMIGHSIGEYAAACLAGVFSVESALELVAARGRLIQIQPPGGMLAIMRSEAECHRYLSSSVTIAAVNAPSLCVVSGNPRAIETLEVQLQQDSIGFRRLRTSHAFHSPMMDPVITPFAELLGRIELKPPQIPFVSNLTGDWISPDQATDPAYWTDHLRHSVRFSRGVETVLGMGDCALLEVGPGHTLSTLASQSQSANGDQVICSSLPARQGKTSLATDGAMGGDEASMLSAAGRLWRETVQLNWSAIHRIQQRYRVPLPTYPFQRKRYWIGADTGAPSIPGPAAASSSVAAEPAAKQFSEQGIEHCQTRLREAFQQLSGRQPDSLEGNRTFLELGFDSLFLTQLSRCIQLEFGTNVSFGQLVDGLNTIDALSRHLAAQPQTIDSSRQPDAAPSPDADISYTPADRTEVNEVQQQLAELTSQVSSLRQTIELLVATSSIGHGDAFAQVAVTEPAVFPLTAGQREIWLACQLSDDASRTFNESYAITLDGAVDPERLDKCLTQLVNRHDALRTTFLADGTAQRVHVSVETKLHRVDAGNVDSGNRLNGRIIEIVEEQFDLQKGPLHRFVLFQLSNDKHILLAVFHHIVIDGWSWGTLLDELGEMYACAESGSAPNLPSPARYADYARWCRSPTQVDRQRLDNQYWANVFSQPHEELELPADHPRPPEKTFVAGHLTVTIEGDQCESLRRASSALNSTLFNFLFTGFQVWLARITQRSDLVVGVPVAGQLGIDENAIERATHLVGHCVNMLPIRTSYAQELCFEDALRASHNNLMEGREHLAFTFGNLLEIVQLKRDPSRIPIVSASFNLAKAHTCNFGSLSCQVERPPKTFNYFDLTLDVIDYGDRLLLDCKFNRDMFDHATAQDWMSQLVHIALQASEIPTAAISRFSLLPETERQHLIEDLNRTDREYDHSATLHSLFEAQVRRTPDAVACIFEDNQLTYRELDQRANTLAAHLREQVDVGADRLIGVCLDRSADMLVALLAVLKTGSAYVPLDPAYPSERIAYIIADAQAVSIIVDGSALDALADLSVPQVDIAQSLMGHVDASIPVPAQQAQSSDLAYVIYTSGSTGKPKGVQIEHRAAVNFLESMSVEPGLKQGDVLLAVTTISFDIAVLELFLPILRGATVVIAPRETAIDAHAIADTLVKHDVTIMQATPATWRMMLKIGWNGKANLKLLCGGEPMPGELAKGLIPRCGQLWNMYGPTETTVWSTVCRIDDPDDIHIGRPIANTQVYIVDEHLQPVPVGVAGELLIGGDGLARGYLGRADLTREKFIDSPFSSGSKVYRTGDLACHRRDGGIDCLGRADDQVKIRGFRIELGEIESVLSEHQHIRQAVAVARQDSSGEAQIVAFYVTASDDEVSPHDLRSYLRTKLAEYMIPSSLIEIDAIPTTPNGKVDRKSLPEMSGQTQPTDSIEPPRTATEKVIASIWKEYLEVAEISVHANFFDHGGHSLLAVAVFQEIERQLGLRLPLGLLISSPTIASLAEKIESQLSARQETWPSLLTLNGESTGKPKLYFVHGAGGDVMLYQKLIHHLGDGVEVYGLQSQGLTGGGEPLRTVIEMAQHYVNEIRSRHSAGPYHLAGYCLGGTIAFEMARLLEREGEPVGFLGLLDTYNFHQMRKPGFVSLFGQRAYFHFRNLLRLPLKNWGPYFVSKLNVMRRGELQLMLRSTLKRRRNTIQSKDPGQKILDLNQRAAFAYEPQLYNGIVSVIKPKSNYTFFPDEMMGWSSVAPRIDLTVLDAFPHAMLEQPIVEQLAAAIIERLEEDHSQGISPAVFGTPIVLAQSRRI